MNQMIVFFTLVVLVAQLHAAPQFITFKDGKLGVNFGGYHAGIAVGGGQGLFAEAGTPYGQQASAGLGGTMGGSGSTGGLFAGATAGNGINAAAGLGGSTNGQNSAGAGYASAQYGNRFAVAGLGGEASEHGSSGVKFAGTNAAPPTVVKETVTVVPVKPNVENEIEGFENVLPLNSGNVDVNLQSRSNIDIPVVDKEVSTWGFRRDYRNYNTPLTFQTVMNSVFSKPGYLHPPLAKPRFQVHRFYKVRPGTVIEKVHYKEHPSHNVHKSVAYLGFNAEGGSDAEVAATEHVGNGGHVTVNKEIQFQSNPNHFADIFNIPITALKSVSELFGSAVDNTKVTVHKTASIGHESNIGSRNAYEPASASSGVSGGHQISVETQQTGSDFFGSIFAIPINTLGAVSKYLDNHVPARKRIQVTQSGDHNIEASAAAGLHLGPHARRRAAKRLLYVDTSKALSETQ